MFLEYFGYDWNRGIHGIRDDEHESIWGVSGNPRSKITDDSRIDLGNKQVIMVIITDDSDYSNRIFERRSEYQSQHVKNPMKWRTDFEEIISVA